MVRKLSLQLLIGMALALDSNALRAQNLLATPGFESGWNSGWSFSGTVIRESLIEENAVSWNNARWYYHSGREAVAVAVGTGKGSGRIWQRVAVSPETEYTARVHFRAADNVQSHTWGLAGEAQRADLVVREFDAGGQQIGAERRVHASESMAWESLSLSFAASPSTASVEIEGFAYLQESFYATLGRAIFDDFSLEGPAPAAVSIGKARTAGSGERVRLVGKIVTASFAGFCYIQEPDRSAGIRVEADAEAGSLVDVIGTIQHSSGEPAIAGASIHKTGTAPLPRALCTSTSAARSDAATGLFSLCWGRVISSDDAAAAFQLADGGGPPLRVRCRTGKPPLVGTFVRATGALGAEQDGDTTIPILRAVAVNIEKGIAFDLPTILWAPSTRPDGTPRYWDPEPLIRLGANYLCVAYRPRRPDGSTWYGVGMTPPRLLEEVLENAQPELRQMHDHGIGVIGYADCILYYTEMLDHDGIDSSGLAALDQNLQPVTNSGWGPTCFVSCVSNPQWVDLQRQVAAVTARSGMDHLMLDIYPYAIAPGYCCHCIHCRDRWSEVSQQRFGSPRAMPPSTLDFADPVHRAFFEWRLDEYSAFVKSVQESGQQVTPGFQVLMNQCADTLDFVQEAMTGALGWPTSELWHLTAGDESTLYMYRLTERANNGRLTAVINDINQVKPPNRYRVTIAEAYAGGGNIYAAAPTGTDEIALISQSYYDFIRANQHCYAGAASQAAVAVLYSWKDHAYLQKPSQGPTVAYGQGAGNFRVAAAVLARLGVPYDCLIVERDLTPEVLARYRVIVTPNLRLLDDASAGVLEQWIRSGGSLLSTGYLGSLKEDGEAFVFRNPGLLTQWTGLATGPSSWNAPMGSGFVSYVAQPYTGDSETTRLPTASYSSAAEYTGLRRQMKITAASPVEAAVRQWSGGVAIHLIRLGPPDAGQGSAVRVDYELPAGSHAQSVAVTSPDFAGITPAAYEVSEERLRIDITRLDTYSLAEVRLCRDELP